MRRRGWTEERYCGARLQESARVGQTFLSAASLRAGAFLPPEQTRIRTPSRSKSFVRPECRRLALGHSLPGSDPMADKNVCPTQGSGGRRESRSLEELRIPGPDLWPAGLVRVSRNGAAAFRFFARRRQPLRTEGSRYPGRPPRPTWIP